MEQDQDFHGQPLEYEPSYQSSYTFRDQYAPMTVGQWVVVIITCLIPVLNVLLLLFWAFVGSINKNLRNFSRAVLVLMIAGALASGAVVGILGLMGRSLPF